jgi:glycosyltransferase involved in cell wall biosynthesis
MSSNTPPLVSIIIPTFNRAHLLSETLDSVLSQTYQNWECIVVDDGSNDDTVVLMKNYCSRDNRFQYHHRPAERLPGGNGARNYGFEVSKGAFIQWFDDDDIMLPKFLESRLQVSYSKVDVLICEGYVVNENLKIEKRIHLNPLVDLYKKYALWELEIYTKSVMFRRSFLKSDLFNEKIKRGQETEFFTRIFFNNRNAKYIILKEPLFYYRKHNETKTEAGKTYRRDYRVNLTYILKCNFDRALILKDHQLIQFYYKRLMKQFFKSLDNKHYQNSQEILKYLLGKLGYNEFYLKIKLLFFGSAYFLFGYRHSIRKRLLNMTVVHFK